MISKELPSALERLAKICMSSEKWEEILGQMRSGVLLGLSGGADSVCLLYLLSFWGTQFSFPIAALHVHHGIRGEEADRDAAFCQRLAENAGVSYLEERISVPKIAKEKKQGVELCARNERYRVLEEARVRLGLGVIATAHNATDSAESVLMHALRGSGLKGICGIPGVRSGLVRPILPLSGKEIRSALQEAQIPYVEDSTNSEPDNIRNFIRCRIFPELEQAVTDPVAALCRLAANAAEDEAFLTAQAEEAYHAILQGDSLQRGMLAELPRPLAVRVISLYCQRLFPESERLERAHAVKLLDLLQTKRAHFNLDVPGGLRFVGERNLLRLEAKRDDRPGFCIPLKMGENPLPGGDMLYLGDVGAEYAKTARNIYKLSIQTNLPSATIYNGWLARSVLPGDVIRMRGHRRRVNQLFSDRKFPLAVRRSLPLVVDDEGVLWIPFLGTRDANACAEDTVSLTYFSKTNME